MLTLRCHRQDEKRNKEAGRFLDPLSRRGFQQLMELKYMRCATVQCLSCARTNLRTVHHGLCYITMIKTAPVIDHGPRSSTSDTVCVMPVLDAPWSITPPTISTNEHSAVMSNTVYGWTDQSSGSERPMPYPGSTVSLVAIAGQPLHF